MPSRPNVVVFVTHDTGRHLGCYGIPEVRSPHLDALAAAGMRFDGFFCSSPMCSPSRAAMFSGLWPQANGVMGLTHAPWRWAYRPGVRHLSHYFRDAGYATIAAGVIHETPDILGSLGFDEHLRGNPASMVMANVPPRLRQLAADRRPFYLQIGTFETHSPYLRDGITPDSERGVHVPERYIRTASAERQFAELQGSIRRADQAVGAVLAALDDTGLAENTIFVYTVDHGIAFPRAKTTLYDPGLGVALLMRWPAGGVTGGRVCRQLLANVDLTPTLLELAGAPVPDGLHGRSFAAACRDDSAPPVREAIFAEHTMPSAHPDARCIRTRRWKLIRVFSPCRIIPIPVDLANPVAPGPSAASETPVVQLYDLESDPGEAHNLAADPAHADTLRTLSRALMDHMVSVRDPILDGPIRWPYYERSMADFRASV